MAAVAALTGSSARATDYFWNTLGDGNFGFAPAWSPFNPSAGQLGPGGPGDRVNFDLGMTPATRYTVRNVSGQNHALIVHNDSLTFSLAGNYSVQEFRTGWTAGDSADIVLTGVGTFYTQDVKISEVAGSASVVTVKNGLKWVNDSYLHLGTSGSGGVLRIEEGASLSMGAGYGLTIATSLGSTGSVTVTGAGSALNSPATMSIGDYGSAALTIENGGSVSGSAALIDGEDGGSATATVRGAGSTWTNSEQLYVGLHGVGTLVIEGGGSVSNTTGYLGFYSNSGSTGVVTVRGAGSTWTNSNELQIGYNAAGTLTIEDGGHVSNTSGYLGFQPGSSGAVTVSGVGSVWTNSGELRVGHNTTATGTLMIKDGGAVSNTIGTIGYNAGSTGTATVRGSGSTWTNSELRIGDSSNGTLTIEAGGKVSNVGGIIGRNAGSSGMVTVTGSGSLWNNTGDLIVGSVGSGILTIADQGEVAVAGSLMANPSARIWLDGGKLTINEFGAGAFQALTWRSGTLRLTNAGGLTLGDGGMFGNSMGLNARQGLEVDGTLSIDAGAELFVSGHVAAGRLVNHGDLILASTTVNGPVTNSASSTVTAIGNVTFNGLVDGPGDFFGPGTVTFNGGMLPGASPAEVTFESGAALGSSNTLMIELGGLLPGTEHDRLNVAGELALGGTLEVLLIEGFTPSVGDTFDLLDWGALSGTFARLDLPSLSGGLSWDSSALYTDGSLSVVPEPTGAVLFGLAVFGLMGFARGPRRTDRSNPRQSTGGKK